MIISLIQIVLIRNYFSEFSSDTTSQRSAKMLFNKTSKNIQKFDVFIDEIILRHHGFFILTMIS